MKQARITSNPALINMGGLISGGLLELGEALDLQTANHDEFTAQLTDYILQHGLHQQGKEELAKRSAAYKTAVKNVRGFMRTTRDVMKPTFGYEYSLAWNALGFVTTMTVPTSVPKLVPMVHAARGYLASHAASEVAPMNVTAAQATILYNAMITAQQAFVSYRLEFKNLGNTRDAKAKALRGKIRLLIAELANTLSPVDPRWERFGLNQPGAQQRPEPPGKVTATSNGPGALSVKWNASPRAEYYRIWLKVVGVDSEAVVVGTRAELDFALGNLPANSVVEISVSAVNSGGESMRSEVLSVTVA